MNLMWCTNVSFRFHYVWISLSGVLSPLFPVRFSFVRILNRHICLKTHLTPVVPVSTGDTETRTGDIVSNGPEGLTGSRSWMEVY